MATRGILVWLESSRGVSRANITVRASFLVMKETKPKDQDGVWTALTLSMSGPPQATNPTTVKAPSVPIHVRICIVILQAHAALFFGPAWVPRPFF